MPDAETLRALLAGLIAGSAAAFATTAVALRAIVRSEQWRARAAGTAVPLPLVGVVLVNGLMLAWTAPGLLLGAAYLRVESTHPAGGLGSPNRLFTLLIAGAVLGALLVWSYLRGRLTPAMAFTGAVALAAFGWLLPLLAG